MGNTQRQLTAVSHTLEFPCGLLPGQDKINFLSHGSGSAAHVCLQHPVKGSVPLRGVVEIGDRLVQRRGRKPGQHILKTAKGNGALIKVLLRLRCLETDAVLHEIVYPPALALFIRVHDIAVLCADNVQRPSGVRLPLAHKAGDSGDVLHQPPHIGKNISVDPLKNITLSFIGHHKEGAVYMPKAVFFTGDRLSCKRKMKYGVLHSKSLPKKAI